MRKLCRCGHRMSLGFRLVIYKNGIQVDRVPIMECDDCERYEVLPAVKSDLLDLLFQLEEKGETGLILFSEMNELANVLYGLFTDPMLEGELNEAMLVKSCEERINLLLDLYGCAQKSDDKNWMDEITVRLATLSSFVSKRQFSGAK
ncbi:hypothetical protein [Paenibacillus brevis]|uniref:YgiT-type zinc finger protein n=1 Tax=Paenibacillus brevis TaxID=2841508 RepID=A0ABS6FRK7_9BACL|nr:hypothetical protein [Paenibacillus brevis]